MENRGRRKYEKPQVVKRDRLPVITGPVPS